MGKLELKFKEKWIGECSKCKKDDAIISFNSDPYCVECVESEFDPSNIWDEWNRPNKQIKKDG